MQPDDLEDLKRLARDAAAHARWLADAGVTDVPAATAIHSTPADAKAVLAMFKPSKEPSRRSLEEIRADLGDCKRCKLCGTRTNIVFGQGNPRAELMFIGEGPGQDEDEQGLAFVGKAGQLLTKMIEA